MSHRMQNIKALLNVGANINHQNKTGETPLLFAAKFNHYDAVCYLLQAGADYQLKDQYGNDLASEIIESTVDRDSELGKLREKAIELLCHKGFDFRDAEQRINERDPRASQEWEREKKARRAKSVPFKSGHNRAAALKIQRTGRNGGRNRDRSN